MYMYIYICIASVHQNYRQLTIYTYTSVHFIDIQVSTNPFSIVTIIIIIITVVPRKINLHSVGVDNLLN